MIINHFTEDLVIMNFIVSFTMIAINRYSSNVICDICLPIFFFLKLFEPDVDIYILFSLLIRDYKLSHKFICC